ncbi:serine kinase [Dyella flagellata]
MASTLQPVARDLCADPFSERYPRHLSVHQQLLGGRFRFESDSQALLDLVVAAFGELPSHRLPGSVPELRIELRLVPERHLPNAAEPPPVQMQSGLGLLLGVINAANYVVISPAQRQALIVVSQDMLEFPYHLRYELIEFAVYVLATRCLGLVPLHGACVGREGRGILLLGDSGAGKSTLALHGLLQGLDFLAEDAVFVQPESLLATGIANYVHVKADGLSLLDSEPARRWIGGSAVIRRRSGVAKFEADLRRGGGRLAAAPLKLVGAVFASAELADDPSALLRPIPKEEFVARLRANQPYASEQAGWLPFQQKLVQTQMHELRRGAHPRAAVETLHALLDRPEAC